MNKQTEKQTEKQTKKHQWVTSSEFDTVVRKCQRCGEKQRIK